MRGADRPGGRCNAHQPNDSLREIRLARALAGSELEGLKAIHEIRAISRLAQSHTEQSARNLDLQALNGALSAIEHQAKRAEERYSKVLEALYEFLDAGEEPGGVGPQGAHHQPDAGRKRR